MINIKTFEAEYDRIVSSLKKRGATDKVKLVEELKKLNEKNKELKHSNEDLRAKRNSLTKEISDLKKAGKDFSSKQKESQDVHKLLVESDKEFSKVTDRIKFIRLTIPNTLHDDVPKGKDDSDNVEVRKKGEVKEVKAVSHGKFLEENNFADFTRASKVSGAGFYFLKNGLVKLELALINYAVNFLSSKGFSPLMTPHILREESYTGITDLNDFEDVMYKVEDEGFLIATSEHIIGAMHSNEVLDVSEPIKYCGVSNCFRKEIGSHGVDTRGLFRVHEFRKVEMFVLCDKDSSWKIHEEMVANTEELLGSLGLPYRIVLLSSGDTGSASSKTYDVECWFPCQNTYRELASISNCIDYQSVAKNIRYSDKGEKDFVHTLNGTGFPIQRLLACIVENYQRSDGRIDVPPVLRDYVGSDVI